MDQQGKSAGYAPSPGVEGSTIKNNIMNSGGNKNKNLRPTSNIATQSTAGQRKKVSDVVPEKK